jgi:ABC-type phosphate transport system substrate-binding protein
MSAGRCIAPPPLVVVTDAQRLAPCRNFEELTTQGSSTVGLGVMPSLIQGFANVNGFQVTRSDDDRNDVRLYQLRKPSPDAPCFRITVRSTGSGTAKDGITDKLAQIGMSSRDYSDGESASPARQGRQSGTGRTQPDRARRRTRRGQCRGEQTQPARLDRPVFAKVFAGKIRDWRELGRA